MRNQDHLTSLTQHPRAAALVRALVGQALQFFQSQESALLLAVRSHLQDMADSRLPPEKAQNVRSAIQLLGQQGPAFRAALRTQLPLSIQEEVAQSFPSLEPTHKIPGIGDLDGLSLSLIDVDEVHRILLLDRICQRFNARYEPGLEPLTLRLGVLRGIENTALADNPFRPLVFARAFMKAWENGPFDQAATEDLMDSLEPDHFLDLTPLYTDLNCTLSSAGIEAQKVHRVRKTADSGFAPLPTGAAQGASANAAAAAPASAPGGSTPNPGTGGHAAQPPSSAWAALVPAGRSIAAQAKAFLQRLGVAAAGAPAPEGASGMHGADASPTSLPDADPQLLHYLDALQAGGSTVSHFGLYAPEADGTDNVLRRLRERDEIRRAPEPDRATVDVLAEVFDYVFADPAIPMQLKVILGRLQIPVLKAAMIDRDFFMSHEHPARKLVDTLAHAAVEWAPERGEQDPLYQRIESTVQRVLTEFADDLTLFQELLAEFTEFLFECEQQAQARNEPVAQHEVSKEALQSALAQADELVHARLQALPEGLPLAPFLTPFLTHQWREVIARAWLAESTQPGAYAAALATMDQLIWSTQPKTTTDERQRLVAVLPELVRTLNTELDAIHWDGDARATFTKRLISTHMLAIRMKAPQPQDAHTANQEKEDSEQALVALEQRRAAKRAAQDDSFDAAARALTRGQWFEVHEGGAPGFRCKLQWISPMRTRFLFTNREGFDAFVRSEREVAAMLRMGQLQTLDQTPIVGRALDKLLASNESELQLAA
ncbi:DUF1631 family protein [Curvibacter sp. APW13]|uniref:DUF1631 family protein n=1 Tax=Curvibacter sp. APW13 TaxID=3077236 RepID=UPI0028E0101A|nr:DUF1631 family protein [Curvibacter sp. APW13]MDT8991201.1 DUF1631 family protein [Curvibacter sp. APW13]